ncbi:MAG: hypothetical protein WCO55_02945 [Candidatus Falkowbacteria bacterium]
MKKILSVFLLALAWFAFTGAPAKAASIAIKNCTDLQNMQNDLKASYYLTNDIDCADTKNWNYGSGFLPIGSPNNIFSGSLDGGCFVIKNLYISASSSKPYSEFHVGLFKDMIGSIKNVGLVNAEIYCSTVGGTCSLGGFSGQTSGSIDTSYVANSRIEMIGSALGNVGGLSGYSYLSSKINNSYVVNSQIKAKGNTKMDAVGGLVGKTLARSSIVNSYSYNNKIYSSYYEGGVIGYVENYVDGSDFGSLTNIFSAQNYLDAGAPIAAGGIAGMISDKASLNIDNIYATNFTNASSNYSVGGVFGVMRTNKIVFKGRAYWQQMGTIVKQCVDAYTADVTTSTKAMIDNNCWQKVMKYYDWYNTSSLAPLNNWDFINIWKANVEALPTLKCFDKATKSTTTPSLADSVNCNIKLSEYSYLKGFGDLTLNDVSGNDALLASLVDQATAAGKNIGECRIMPHWDTGFYYIYSYKKCTRVSPDPDQTWANLGMLKKYMVQAIKNGDCCCSNCNKVTAGTGTGATSPNVDAKVASFQNDMSALYAQYTNINDLTAAAKLLATKYQGAATNGAVATPNTAKAVNSSILSMIAVAQNGEPVTITPMTLYKVNSAYYYWENNEFKKVLAPAELTALKNRGYKDFGQTLAWSSLVEQAAAARSSEIMKQSVGRPYTAAELNFMADSYRLTVNEMLKQ